MVSGDMSSVSVKRRGKGEGEAYLELAVSYS